MTRAILTLTIISVLTIERSVAINYQAENDSLKILVIGNSFSKNATLFLPELAAMGGYPLKIQKAEIGGSSLEKHWALVQKSLDDPGDSEGRPYQGESLRDLLEKDQWDYVTMQQLSILSCDIETYLPYIQQLHEFIKETRPETTVLIHRTWAYRTDSKRFCRLSESEDAQSDMEMWETLKGVYTTIANQLNLDIIPSGDAFWKVSSDSLRYRPDPTFDESTIEYPDLPIQTNSLHKGYHWQQDKTLRFDAIHGSVAGCYLGSLVWYYFLFDESPDGTGFVPEGLDESFARYLQKVAYDIVINHKQNDIASN